MMKRVLLAGILAMAVSSPALAGKATLKHSNGAKVRLDCNGGGCYARETNAAGKRGKRTKIGPGGRSNFLKFKASYNSKGYN